VGVHKSQRFFLGFSAIRVISASAHHSPGIQTQWFALPTLAAIKRLKVGVCADRDLISIPGLREHGFYDADRGVGGDAIEFEAGFLEEVRYSGSVRSWPPAKVSMLMSSTLPG
jgi:hypothetical protein